MHHSAALTGRPNSGTSLVTAPDGTTYLGNVFAGGWSQSAGSADRTNNLENVYIADAMGGTWTVTVRGAGGVGLGTWTSSTP